MTHMSLTHHSSKSKKVSCNYCSKVYSNTYKLKVHQRTYHKGKKQKFGCSVCDLKSSNFSTYRTLMNHVESHHLKERNKTTFTCDVCGVEYYSTTKLDQHMNIDHAGPFKCLDKKCTRAFKGIPSRKHHYLYFHSQDIKVRRHDSLRFEITK